MRSIRRRTNAFNSYKEVLSKLPCQIIQGYGQTEGTMTFLSQEDHIKAAIEGVNEERLKSCGREGFVTSVKVVDKDGNPVPNDSETPGEIIVRSDANMVGYFRRPDLTEKTIRNGWMWTGDIATWDKIIIFLLKIEQRYDYFLIGKYIFCPG